MHRIGDDVFEEEEAAAEVRGRGRNTPHRLEVSLRLEVQNTRADCSAQRKTLRNAEEVTGR